MFFLVSTWLATLSASTGNSIPIIKSIHWRKRETTKESCENNHLQMSGLGMEHHPVYNTENKTNSLQGAQAAQANNNNVWRSTGRAGYETTAACTRCTPLFVWRRESESKRRCLRKIERKRESVWKWQTKSNTTPVILVSGQLNHQESGKIPSPPSMNSSQKNHISMTSPWRTQ